MRGERTKKGERDRSMGEKLNERGKINKGQLPKTVKKIIGSMWSGLPPDGDVFNH